MNFKQQRKKNSIVFVSRLSASHMTKSRGNKYVLHITLLFCLLSAKQTDNCVLLLLQFDSCYVTESRMVARVCSIVFSLSSSW